MTLYFENLINEAEIKQRYKELAKAHHPDLGGCVETMKIINTQYEKVLTGAYQKAGKSITEIDELLAKDEALRSHLNKILHLDGLIIELCGCWLWVTGDTKTHKDVLKDAKFLWSPKKGAWYWRAEANHRRFNKQEYDLFAIRERHGSIKVQKRERVLVA